jgi:ABC-type sugar transport system substrate-binding protein
MRVKKAIALAAVALLPLAACSAAVEEAEVAAPAPVVAEEPVEVLFLSFTNDITEMAGQILEGMNQEFAAQGFSVEVQTAAPAGAEDNEGFDRLLQDAITINPDYLMVLPASYDLVEDRLVEIEAAGIKTIVVNFFPGMLAAEPRIDPLTWITVNERLMGEVGGEYMAQGYCDEGISPKTVPFYGPIASEISIQRLGGTIDKMTEVLEACGQELIILEEIYADFNREKAFTFAENIATKYPAGGLDLIIGANSNTALGVMEALIGQNRIGDVDILGMGGQLDEMAAICRGEIKAAGYRNSLLMGATIAKSVIDTEAGLEVEKITLPPIPLVNDCESVFKEMPEVFWEFEGFKRNISEELFNQYAN